MKLKIWIASKSIYIPAEFAQDFLVQLNTICAVAQEKKGDNFVPFEALTLELRAD